MKKIGIIGAMELEVETLKSKMNVVKTTKKANMEFFEGTLNGVEVVIVRSGIGKVNAGICTQILADLFDVTHIINTGIAGSLDAQIDIGDIVVSTDVLQHDMDVRVFGYPLGEIPQLGTLSFPADERMASLARSVCEKVNTEVKVFSGRIVSGDQFICDKEDLGWVNMDSQAPNKVVQEWLETQGYDEVKPEYTYGDSRIDFYMRKGEQEYLMEVKGCTLEVDGIGYFPDAPTTRGVKHLRELAKASSLGYRCFIAFVI